MNKERFWDGALSLRTTEMMFIKRQREPVSTLIFDRKEGCMKCACYTTFARLVLRVSCILYPTDLALLLPVTNLIPANPESL
jgi:hypothetical protein